MAMMFLLLLFSLIFIRIFAGYDSRFQKGRFFEIRNKTLSKILLNRDSFFARRKRLKKDLNKISVQGVVFYGCALFVILLVVILLFFVPDIPIEPWEISSERFSVYVETLNEKISAIVIWLLLLSVMGYMSYVAVRVIRNAKNIEVKWVRILVYVLMAVMSVAIVALTVYMLWELILSFF